MVLSPDPNAGGFSVSCPAMPGAHSQGDSREETLANIAEAMTLWMEVADEDGYGPRVETPELIATEIAFVLEFRAEEGWPLIVETAEVQIPVAVAA